jgi:hypothetical protein
MLPGPGVASLPFCCGQPHIPHPLTHKSESNVAGPVSAYLASDRLVLSLPASGFLAEALPSHGDYIHYRCPKCGEFKMSGTVA